MDTTPRYWFPAKQYGWGWGLPATWQGWVVLATWMIAMTAVGIFVAPYSLPWFFVSAAVLTTVLIAICWRTGEPPRWR